MKKTFLALFMAGSCCAAVAQVEGDSAMKKTQTQTGDTTMSVNSNWNTTPTTTTTIQGNQHKVHANSMTTTGDYSAYGTTSVSIPSTVQVYFDRDYPNSGAVTWRKKGDWYYATYNKMGRYNHVYYNERGDTYTVALPVTHNYVPDDIVMKVGNMFGDMVYDISSIKGTEGKTIYHIRTIEGDQLKSNWVGEDGSTITDPFRPADSVVIQTDMNTNVNVTTDTTGQHMHQNTTTDSTMNKDKEGLNQPDPMPDGSSEDGSNNNNTPVNHEDTRDYAILPQQNDLRKKS